MSDDFLCFGLQVLFSSCTFGREICYQNIYSVDLIMRELVILGENIPSSIQNVQFAFSQAPVFLPPPLYPEVPRVTPVKNLWICNTTEITKLLAPGKK